jgi:hypothetical protein
VCGSEGLAAETSGAFVLATGAIGADAAAGFITLERSGVGTGSLDFIDLVRPELNLVFNLSSIHVSSDTMSIAQMS